MRSCQASALRPSANATPARLNASRNRASGVGRRARTARAAPIASTKFSRERRPHGRRALASASHAGPSCVSPEWAAPERRDGKEACFGREREDDLRVVSPAVLREAIFFSSSGEWGRNGGAAASGAVLAAVPAAGTSLTFAEISE